MAASSPSDRSSVLSTLGVAFVFALAGCAAKEKEPQAGAGGASPSRSAQGAAGPIGITVDWPTRFVPGEFRSERKLKGKTVIEVLAIQAGAKGELIRTGPKEGLKTSIPFGWEQTFDGVRIDVTEGGKFKEMFFKETDGKLVEKFVNAPRTFVRLTPK